MVYQRRRFERREMRICVTGLRGLPGVMGGVESHCEELLPRILALYPKLAIRLVGRKPYLPEGVAEFKGVEVVSLPSPRQQSLEAIVSTFLAVLHARRYGWRLIHIHAIGPGLLAPLARMVGLRVVLTHHGRDYDRAKWNPFARAMLRLGEWAGVAFAHRVIAVSPSLAEALKQQFPAARGKISYVPNGAPALADSQEGLPEVLSRLGVDERPYVLAVGRLVPEKGFDYLVRAFLDSGTDRQLLIAGAADHETDYSRKLLATAGERVRFLGRQPRSVLRKLYEGADLFVLPSFHEGLPIVALEAASCGAPMLLSDIGANRDIGLAEGNYFPVGDEAALSAALARPRPEFAIDGPAIRSRFDWDVVARETLEIYRLAY
ncbi:glycosyltransferase family 4 protein [Caulobacter hibisci]|uniref:Glycosyltransferase family 4 protein n=1 Tax=Caulobacter hibisci TaxID=2035993 RepID=A0ABS0T560_9CAUL|nr:glycosyltransferase family 4 protein [Caulobacter hibisci]MBI1687017.1 glycosyltransferase family 4 protein [Caulobacter hibisci]